MTDLALPSPPPPASTEPTRARLRRVPRIRWRPRQLLAKGHRWSSFGLGLLLLVIVITGVLLMLKPEIEQVTNPSLYGTAEGPSQVLPGEALATVHRELPDYNVVGATMVENRGAWEVLDEEGKVARVDDTTGEFLGTIDREHGVMAFLANLHECGLSCEGMTGYVSFLNKPAKVAGFDISLGNEGTWGGMILALSAFVLLGLSVSGLILWWPGRRRLRRGLVVRRGRGRYKLNYDLHKVAGFVALPFLLMWALTGAMFELPKQADAVWYALTPGEKPAEVDFESKPIKGESISMPEAIERARAAVPSDSRLISVNNPDRSEPTSYYEMWFAHGIDTYRFGSFPGNYGVEVDRYSGRAFRYWPGERDPTVTGEFWQNWAGPIHMGMLVGWIPRLAWVGFGIVPILLAVTGITTWLLRRRLRKRKGPGHGPGGGAVAAA